ncbi:MAG: DUF4783 domain-containing protein [Melioribacteraceae bacterium]|nr:DUF4783 domain-containing protein [Melioribacteraceae bacterium]
MSVRTFILIFFFLGLNCSETIIAQETRSKEVQKLLYKIEDGLASGSVDKFSGYFGNRNYLSLSNGSNGYFSANQSYYVIKDYLSIYQPITFKFTNIVSDSNTPFAAGSLRYNNNGVRGNATVFVTLQLIDNQWYISQITIN